MPEKSSRLTLTAVLFTGGESRRMGADKATLIFNGEPLWSRQLKLLRELNPEKIMVSARTRPAWCPPEMDSAADEPPSRGPLGGLAAALKKISTTHFLALAVDLSRMNAAQLKTLCGKVAPECGIVPVSAGGYEPLCAVYPAGQFVLETAEAFLAGGDFSLQHFVAALVKGSRLKTFPISKNDEGFYFNANTPEDLR